MNYKEYWKEQVKLQLNWREMQSNISKEFGYQNKNKYAHILPKDEWHKTIWGKFKNELLEYLERENIQHHTGSHNLLSSWILCSNLYFGAFVNDNIKNLFQQFLEYKLSIKIDKVKNIQLEFVLPEKLSPVYLLGEPGGKRGTKQTTPDLAIEYITNGKENLILVECKYTEHSFYDCPVKELFNCKQVGQLNKYCVQKETLKRKYWDYLSISEYGCLKLHFCPAFSGGYQIFRQQALAEALLKHGKYESVWSCVAYDGRNDNLMKCMKDNNNLSNHKFGTPITSIKNEWENLFENLKTKFMTWEHQEWVKFVRENEKESFSKEWCEYIENRYRI
jgi:hypothetical protein